MTKQELPQDVDQCHDMILQMYERMCKMEQQINQLVRSKYGRKSEVADPNQLRLFTDLEPDVVTEQPIPKPPVTQVRGHGRRKPPRQLLHVRKEYVIDEEQLSCPECARIREVFGEEITEQYDYVPA